MTEPVLLSKRDVFEKMDEEAELQGKLATEFPEYEYVRAWDRYLGFLRHDLDELDTCLSQIMNGTNAMELREIERKAHHKLYNFICSIQGLQQSISSTRAKPALNKRFFDLVEKWRRRPLAHVVLAIRHDYEHGRLVFHVLKCEWKAKTTTSAESLLVGMDLEEESWRNPTKERCDKTKKFLADFRKHHRHPLVPLLREFLVVFGELVTDARKIFDEAFSSQVEARKATLTRLKEIEDWYEANGVGPRL